MESVNQPIEEKATLKVADVAKRFGVEPSTVYRWAARGKIKSHRTPGGQLRFKPSEIEKQEAA